MNGGTFSPARPGTGEHLMNDDIECIGFLAEIGMSQYVETFLVNMSMDGKILRRNRMNQLRQNDLSRMGITNYVHQKVLMDHIRHVLQFSFHSPIRKKELKSKTVSYSEKTGIDITGAFNDAAAAKEQVPEYKGNNAVAEHKPDKKTVSSRRRRSFDTNVWQSISNLRTKAASHQSAAESLREGVFNNVDTKSLVAKEKTRRRSFDIDKVRRQSIICSSEDDDGNATASSLHQKAQAYGNMAQEYDMMIQQLKVLQNEHIQRFKTVVNCEIASVMFINSMTRELLMLADNNTWYRFPMGSGLAGYAAETGHTLNVPDAYADHRFNRNMDIRTGFKTRNVLCQPLRNMRGGGQIVGVIEAVNKRNGEDFDQQDEEALANCVEQVANDLAQRFRELLLSAEKFTGNAVFISGKMKPAQNFKSNTTSSSKRADSGRTREEKEAK